MTPKQERFILEYLIDLNATQAAIRAGYSKKTAHVIGHENLTKPVIAQAIDEAKAKRAEEIGIDATWVLRGVKQLYEDSVRADDRTNTRGALDLAGKHTHVKAWDDKKTLEHTGTMEVVTGVDKGVNSGE